MATPFDDLVGRLTHRLRMDPELQLEIAQELRTHLQDCAADFQAGGMKEDDAAAAAIKALGDETEIAEKLWQANRRRVRLRKAVKWAVGVTLLPAAGAVAVSIGWGAIVAWAILFANFQFIATRPSTSTTLVAARHLADRIAADGEMRAIHALPPRARLEFDRAEIQWPQTLPLAKALAEEHGSDPVYWANYATWTAASFWSPAEATPGEVEKAKKAMSDDLAILDRCAKVDPGNALYPLFKASILMGAAAQDVEIAHQDNPPLPAYAFQFTSQRSAPYSNAMPRKFELTPFTITDPSLFQQGLNALREAAGKSYFQTHTLDVAQRTFDLFPRPITLADWATRMGFEYRIPVPFLSRFGQGIELAGWAAYEAATHDQSAAALRIVHDARRVCLLATQNRGTGVEFVEADQWYLNTWGQEVLVYQQLNDRANFQRSLARFVDEDRIYYQQAHRWNFPPWDEARQATGRDTVLYTLFDQSALSGMLICLIGASILMVLPPLWTRAFYGRWPALLFIGWERLLTILTIGVLLPIGAYAIYAEFTPLGNRQYLADERVIVEYAALAATIFVLVRALTNRAVRLRATEINIPALQPRPVGRVPVAIGLALAAAVCIYLIVWHHAVIQPTEDAINSLHGWGIGIAAAVTLYGLIWLVWPGTYLHPGEQLKTTRVAIVGCLLGITLIAIGQYFAQVDFGWQTPVLPVSGWIETLLVATLLLFNGWQLTAAKRGRTSKPALLAIGCLIGFGLILAGVLAGVFGLDDKSVIPACCGWTEIALGAPLLLLNVPQLWKLWRFPKPVIDSPPQFSLSLATIPSFLAAALSLGLIAGVPLRLHEKQIAADLDDGGRSYQFYYVANDDHWPQIQERYAGLLAVEKASDPLP